MNKQIFVLTGLLFLSCGDQKKQNTITDENHASWKQETPTDINEDNRTAEIEKKISGNSSIQTQNEPEGPKISKGEWGEKYGKTSFLYSAYIDSIVKLKNKAINAYNDQSDGWSSSTNVLGEKSLCNLPAKQLLYYCLTYPAYFSQNCTAFPIPTDGGTYFAQFFPVERHISGVQTHCLRLKRDSVCLLLEKLFQENDTIHIETLDLIHRANLVDMIPSLCKKASFNKNPYIFTLFINMMNSNHYKPFTRSAYYTHLSKNISPMGALIAKKTDADSVIKYSVRFYQAYQNTSP